MVRGIHIMNKNFQIMTKKEKLLDANIGVAQFILRNGYIYANQKPKQEDV